MSVILCVCVCVYECQSVLLSVCLSGSAHECHSVCLCVCLYECQSVCLTVVLFV